MNFKKIIPVIIVIVLIGSVGFMLAFRPAPSPSVSSEAAISPNESELVDAKGNPVNFSDFEGKVVFINDWASWCRPCVAKMPTIVALKEAFSEDELVVVMVSFDQQRETGLQWMEQQGFDLPVYFPGKDFPQQFVTNAIPATFILDQRGEILHSQMGMADYSHPAFIEQMKQWINL